MTLVNWNREIPLSSCPAEINNMVYAVTHDISDGGISYDNMIDRLNEERENKLPASKVKKKAWGKTRFEKLKSIQEQYAGCV